MQELNKKVVLVTGGGQGLGAAICQTLCESGATVIAADIKLANVEKLTKDLKQSGSDISTIQLDVSDEGQVKQALQEIYNKYKKIDAVINNAGTDVTLSIDELSVSDWDRIIATNLRGPFLISKFAFPFMKQQGQGYIINIASTAAKRAWPNASGYHASKWGLLGLSHALHSEMRAHNIKVTAVVCGGMRTPFLLDRFPDIDINNLQDPKNVAQTIRFLLTQPQETVIPEVMVLPMRETSWP